MKTLLLLGCLFFSVMAGYWLMVKLDGFLARGGIRPYWDEEEEEMSGGAVYQAEESRQLHHQPIAGHLLLFLIPIGADPSWGNLHTRRQ